MTKAVYEYKAVAKGTLSRPYRFFKEGEVIRSREPLDNPALVPLDEYVESKPKVLVPFMTINGVKQRPDYEGNAPSLAQEQKSRGVPPTPAHPSYDRAMEGVKRMEAMLDGNGTPAPAVDPEAELKQGGAGTGNQNVI